MNKIKELEKINKEQLIEINRQKDIIRSLQSQLKKGQKERCKRVDCKLRYEYK